MKVMINKIIRKKYGKFQSGSFGKKNILIALSGRYKEKKIKTIKKKLEFPPKDSNYRYSNFKFQ